MILKCLQFKLVLVLIVACACASPRENTEIEHNRWGTVLSLSLIKAASCRPWGCLSIWVPLRYPSTPVPFYACAQAATECPDQSQYPGSQVTKTSFVEVEIKDHFWNTRSDNKAQIFEGSHSVHSQIFVHTRCKPVLLHEHLSRITTCFIAWISSDTCSWWAEYKDCNFESTRATDQAPAATTERPLPPLPPHSIFHGFSWWDWQQGQQRLQKHQEGQIPPTSEPSFRIVGGSEVNDLDRWAKAPRAKEGLCHHACQLRLAFMWQLKHVTFESCNLCSVLQVQLCCVTARLPGCPCVWW